MVLASNLSSKIWQRIQILGHRAAAGAERQSVGGGQNVLVGRLHELKLVVDDGFGTDTVIQVDKRTFRCPRMHVVRLAAVMVAFTAASCSESSVPVDRDVRQSQDVVIVDSVETSVRRVGDSIEIYFTNLDTAKEVRWAGDCLASVVATQGDRIVWDQRQEARDRFCTDDGVVSYLESGAMQTVQVPLPEEVLDLGVLLHAGISIPRHVDRLWLKVR